MNTQRYGWPVIIAASLHGALFLISSEPTVAISPPKKITEVWLKPPVDDPVEMRPEEAEEHDTSPAGGAAKALPSTPDVLEPLRGNEPFTVPVQPYKPSLDPVKTLEGFTGLPSGPGDPNGIGRPSLPDVGRLDRVPRAMVQTPPAYPDGARREGRDGTVTVEFVVGLDGQVTRAEAIKWTHREFVEPAVRAVLRWRFEPGTIGGRKVSFRMAVPIEFNATR